MVAHLMPEGAMLTDFGTVTPTRGGPRPAGIFEARPSHTRVYSRRRHAGRAAIAAYRESTLTLADEAQRAGSVSVSTLPRRGLPTVAKTLDFIRAAAMTTVYLLWTSATTDPGGSQSPIRSGRWRPLAYVHVKTNDASPT